MSETFYSDDFFALTEDPGVSVAVKMRGRMVPLRLKRGLTLADKSTCQQLALKKTITPEGKVIIQGMDETVLVEELLLRCVLDWPFTDRTSGEKLPITRENIRNMLGGVEQIAQYIKALDEDGEAAMVPFAPESDEA